MKVEEETCDRGNTRGRPRKYPMQDVRVFDLNKELMRAFRNWFARYRPHYCSKHLWPRVLSKAESPSTAYMDDLYRDRRFRSQYRTFLASVYLPDCRSEKMQWYVRDLLTRLQEPGAQSTNKREMEI